MRKLLTATAATVALLFSSSTAKASPYVYSNDVLLMQILIDAQLEQQQQQYDFLEQQMRRHTLWCDYGCQQRRLELLRAY